MIAPLSLALFSVLAGPGSKDFERPLDTVKAAEGKKQQEGRIVYVDQDKLVLISKSRSKVIDRADVAEFTSVNMDLMSIMPELRSAPTALQSKGLESLAKTCHERGLLGEAELVWWSLIRLEPENEAAHEALENRKMKGNWQTKKGGRWWDMERLREKAPDWGKAFELNTTHFEITSSLPWFETVRASIMAEEIYVRYFESLGKDFEMYWPSRVIELHFHGDNSYGGGDNLAATVDLESRRVSLDFEDGFLPFLLARHMNEMLVNESVWQKGKGRSALPLWLAIGMQETMQAHLGLMSVEDQIIDFNTERDHPHNRSLHMGAKKTYSFTRVINFGDGDFRSADVGLQRAQAYTLFAFCMYGKDGKNLEGLNCYMGRVLDGRGSSTDFLGCMDITKQKQERAFEGAWMTWVKDKE